MRTLSTILVITTFVTIAACLFAGLFEGGWGSKVSPSKILQLAVLTVIMLLTVASCWTMLLAFSLPKGVWWVPLGLGALLLVLVGWMLVGDRWNPDGASVVVVTLVSFALLIVPLFKLLDDNPYELTRGKVIEQSYSEASFSTSCVNGICITTPIPEDWGLHLENCENYNPCRDGWLHFSSDILAAYPVGSQYP